MKFVAVQPATVDHKQALIIKFGQIGDVIMTLPAVRALHDSGYKIDWVCGKAVAPLLAQYSWIRLIVADDKALFFGANGTRAKALLEIWKSILGRKYDLVATLYYDNRYRLLALPVRSRRKLMLNQHSRATTLLPGRNPADETLRVLLETVDGYHNQSSAPLRPDSLPSRSLGEKRRQRRIAIVPGGAGQLIREQAQQRQPGPGLRRWPLENFVAVAEELNKRQWEVVLIGGPEDTWASGHFARLWVTDLIGKLSLPEVVSVCDGCDAVITHDTGPLHLAGLSTACLIGIFGPTNPATFLPRRPDTVGIWGGQGFACRPCYDGRNFAPCQFNGCMHQVTPELVLRELDRLLDTRSKGISMPWYVTSPEGV